METAESEANEYIAKHLKNATFQEISNEYEKLNENAIGQEMKILENMKSFMKDFDRLQEIDMENLKQVSKELVKAHREMLEEWKGRIVPLVESRKKQNDIQDAMAFMEKYKLIFEIPEKMRNYLKLQQYTELMEEYRKSIWHREQNMHVVFKPVFDAADKIATAAGRDLVGGFTDAFGNMDKQKKILYTLKSLKVIECPLKDCIVHLMKKYIMEDSRNQTMVLVAWLKELHSGLFELILPVLETSADTRTLFEEFLQHLIGDVAKQLENEKAQVVDRNTVAMVATCCYHMQALKGNEKKMNQVLHQLCSQCCCVHKSVVNRYMTGFVSRIEWRLENGYYVANMRLHGTNEDFLLGDFVVCFNLFHADVMQLIEEYLSCVKFNSNHFQGAAQHTLFLSLLHKIVTRYFKGVNNLLLAMEKIVDLNSLPYILEYFIIQLMNEKIVAKIRITLPNPASDLQNNYLQPSRNVQRTCLDTYIQSKQEILIDIVSCGFASPLQVVFSNNRDNEPQVSGVRQYVFDVLLALIKVRCQFENVAFSMTISKEESRNPLVETMQFLTSVIASLVNIELKSLHSLENKRSNAVLFQLQFECSVFQMALSSFLTPDAKQVYVSLVEQFKSLIQDSSYDEKMQSLTVEFRIQSKLYLAALKEL